MTEYEKESLDHLKAIRRSLDLLAHHGTLAICASIITAGQYACPEPLYGGGTSLEEALELFKRAKKTDC